MYADVGQVPVTQIPNHESTPTLVIGVDVCGSRTPGSIGEMEAPLGTRSGDEGPVCLAHRRLPKSIIAEGCGPTKLLPCAGH
jgi:hypothetical protein